MSWTVCGCGLGGCDCGGCGWYGDLFVVVDALQEGRWTLVLVVAPLQLVAGLAGGGAGPDGMLVVQCLPDSELCFGVFRQPVPAGYQAGVGVVIGMVFC